MGSLLCSQESAGRLSLSLSLSLSRDSGSSPIISNVFHLNFSLPPHLRLRSSSALLLLELPSKSLPACFLVMVQKIYSRRYINIQTLCLSDGKLLFQESNFYRTLQRCPIGGYTFATTVQLFKRILYNLQGMILESIETELTTRHGISRTRLIGWGRYGDKYALINILEMFVLLNRYGKT